MSDGTSAGYFEAMTKYAPTLAEPLAGFENLYAEITNFSTAINEVVEQNAYMDPQERIAIVLGNDEYKDANDVNEEKNGLYGNFRRCHRQIHELLVAESKSQSLDTKRIEQLLSSYQKELFLSLKQALSTQTEYKRGAKLTGRIRQSVGTIIKFYEAAFAARTDRALVDAKKFDTKIAEAKFKHVAIAQGLGGVEGVADTPLLHAIDKWLVFYEGMQHVEGFPAAEYGNIIAALKKRLMQPEAKKADEKKAGKSRCC